MNGTCHLPPSPLEILVSRAIKSVVSVYNTQGGSKTSSTKLLLLEDTPGGPPSSRPRGSAAEDDGRVAGTAKDLVAEVQVDGATFTAIVEAETRQLQSSKQSVAVASPTCRRAPPAEIGSRIVNRRRSTPTTDV
jgi:hypothetical protein